MNNTPRLSKSGIEYLDYVWNFYSGCRHKQMGICQVDKCWAEGITKRMGHNYPTGFKPAFYPEAFVSPVHLKKPSIIGCAFMGDLFGDWVNPDEKFHATMPSGKASITMSLKGWIFTTIRQCPQHRFLFLTKNPSGLVKWEKFPDNCWGGVTVTKPKFLLPALDALDSIQCSVRYLSIEPMLARFDVPDLSLLLEGSVDWLILGSQTKPYKPPKMVWIDEIVRACDKVRIPVFLKNNLQPLADEVFAGARTYSSPILTSENKLRQEMPK